MDANPFECEFEFHARVASQIGLHGFHSGDDARGLTTSNSMAPVLVGDTGRILVKPSQHVNVNGGCSGVLAVVRVLPDPIQQRPAVSP